jgi:RNA polymerase sigma-70 factor (ECF subfamily)
VAEDARLSPEAVFDRQWAVTVLERAMQALDAECQAQGKPELVNHLRPWLMGESGYGDQSAAAAALSLSLPAMKAVIHRLRSRFRQMVKAEVAGTLGQDGSVEDEMRSLFAALAG